MHLKDDEIPDGAIDWKDPPEDVIQAINVELKPRGFTIDFYTSGDSIVWKLVYIGKRKAKTNRRVKYD